MASCRACGAAIAEGARFCPECGQPIGPRCPSCASPVEEAARFCPSCGAAIASLGRVDEERKLATILFADITGSTAMGEQLDPERMRVLLRTYFSAMSEVLASWGGRLEKFIGDAIMAAFGVPIAREDDPMRALNAALEMLARLEELNVTFRERHGVAMQLRIGVNTGEVIAPADPAQELVLAGDAVNVAARLEQTAEPGTVVVGERTYRAARGSFLFGEPTPLALKGKAEAVIARRLLAAAPEPTRALPGIRAPLVGRDRELRMLDELLAEAVETARPHMALLSGPAGIGKSRLMQEFVRHASESAAGARVLRGRCLPVGHGITYWALGEVLRSFAGIGLDEPADVAVGKLTDSVSALVGRSPGADADATPMIRALALTAGISLPENPLEALDPEAISAELGRTWPQFTSALAREAPTVLVIEDVHWAGEQLVEMLERVVTRSDGPLFILATARPEFADSHPRFGAGSDDATVIGLRPLTENQSAELISGLLDATELPDRLRDEILQKAEGNPFFVEEMIRRLIDEGALVREDGEWRTTEAASRVTLPDSVHALLAARIDALPLHEKRVLQEASVIGRIFWQAPVERSAGNGAVAPALLKLEQRGLVLARPTSTIAGEAEYIFKHALVRDVAYASLPKARRARAHAEAGSWIEELAGDRIDEFAELVAHHYRSAVAGEDSDLAWEGDDAARERIRAKAFRALLAAGIGARRRFEVEKAIELHEAALGIAATREERATVLEELGDSHFGLYHCDEALAVQREAQELRGAPAERGDRARLAVKIARTCGRWGAFRQKPDPAWAEGVIERGLAEADSEEIRVALLALRGNAHVYWRAAEQPDPVPEDQRVAWGEEALAGAERLGDTHLLARVVGPLAVLYAARGQFRRAFDVYNRLSAVVDELPSRDQQASIFSALSEDLLLTAGQPARALDYAWRGYWLAQGTSRHELMHSTSPLLRVLFWAGRWAEIPAVIDAHLAAFPYEAEMSCPEVQMGPIFAARFYTEIGDNERTRSAAALIREERALVGGSQGPSPAVVQLADYALAHGRIDDALRYSASLADTASPEELRWVAGTRLEALVAASRWDDLTAFIDRLAPLKDEMPALAPLTARARGLAHRAARRDAEAEASLRKAVDGFDRYMHPFLGARTREDLASVLGPDDARQLWAEALETYERLGARPHAERVRETLR